MKDSPAKLGKVPYIPRYLDLICVTFHETVFHRIRKENGDEGGIARMAWEGHANG